MIDWDGCAPYLLLGSHQRRNSVSAVIQTRADRLVFDTAVFVGCTHADWFRLVGSTSVYHTPIFATWYEH
jgi:hypothetical protein